MSVSKIGAGQEAYYLDAVAQGVEDYYLGHGEAPAGGRDRHPYFSGSKEKCTPTICVQCCRAATPGTVSRWSRPARTGSRVST